MSAFGRLQRSVRRAAAGVSRRTEVAVGLVLVFGGLVLLREIGQILGGRAAGSESMPGGLLGLLVAAAALGLALGLRLIHSGF